MLPPGTVPKPVPAEDKELVFPRRAFYKFKLNTRPHLQAPLAINDRIKKRKDDEELSRERWHAQRKAKKAKKAAMVKEKIMKACASVKHKTAYKEELSNWQIVTRSDSGRADVEEEVQDDFPSESHSDADATPRPHQHNTTVAVNSMNAQMQTRHNVETTSTRRPQHLHGNRALPHPHPHQSTLLGKRSNTTSAPDEEPRTKRVRLDRTRPEENVRGRRSAKAARRMGF
jgi:hypothetical protein